MWPALLDEIKEGFLGLKEKSFKKKKKAGNTFQGKRAIRVTESPRSPDHSGHLSVTETQSRFSERR